MAFSSSLVIADGQSTPVDRTFVLTSQDATNSTRIDNSTTLTAPRIMQIKHSVQKLQNGDVVDRHLVSFSHTVLDAANVPHTLVGNLTLAVPRSTITRANVDDVVAFLKNFTTSSDITSLLIGES